MFYYFLSAVPAVVKLEALGFCFKLLDEHHAGTWGAGTKGLFFCSFSHGLGMPLRRLYTIRGMSRTREDESSHRERVEDSSASLTLVQGVVESSQKAHPPMAEQRVPF